LCYSRWSFLPTSSCVTTGAIPSLVGSCVTKCGDSSPLGYCVKIGAISSPTDSYVTPSTLSSPIGSFVTMHAFCSPASSCVKIGAIYSPVGSCVTIGVVSSRTISSTFVEEFILIFLGILISGIPLACHFLLDQVSFFGEERPIIYTMMSCESGVVDSYYFFIYPMGYPMNCSISSPTSSYIAVCGLYSPIHCSSIALVGCPMKFSHVLPSHSRACTNMILIYPWYETRAMGLLVSLTLHRFFQIYLKEEGNIHQPLMSKMVQRIEVVEEDNFVMTLIGDIFLYEVGNN
jgi:hypothetical protein